MTIDEAMRIATVEDAVPTPHEQAGASCVLAEEVERLRKWQQTPAGENCTGVEQLNRIVAGLVRQYGSEGALTLSAECANGVPLGQQIAWCCTGGKRDFIRIQEAEAGKEGE